MSQVPGGDCEIRPGMVSPPVVFFGMNLTLFSASNSAAMPGSAWPFQASMVSSVAWVRAVTHSPFRTAFCKFEIAGPV